MTLLPRSLFARTAVLVGGMLLVFSLIAWQIIVWSAIEPAAQLTVHILAQRARDAEAALARGTPLPPDARFETTPPPEAMPRLRGLAYGSYVETLRRELKRALDSPDIRIGRMAAPAEIWVNLRSQPNRWLVLSWRLAGPKAPLAALLILAAAALLVLGVAALSARRLTAPLAALAAAAARVAAGDKVAIAMTGPTEVRSVAAALQSMSHRLAELDEQRELMLAGISHDLRTPLARLRVAVELLDQESPALLEEMTNSIEEMDRMIGQFLHYVRAHYRETPSLSCLDQVVRQTLSSYATDERVRLDLRAGEARHFAVDCVRHTLLNLLQNALEYGRAPVTVITSLGENSLTLCVEDRGDGLSAAQWADAVRPFHRLSASRDGSHTGLGLALVERLIRSCDGHWQGRQYDGGFTIQVDLPARETRPSPRAICRTGRIDAWDAPGAPAGRSNKVL